MLMLGWAKASKCKKLLKQVRSRLECLEQERFATSMQLRQDLDQKIDYEALNLRIEQEQHIRDESSAYDLLDYSCKLILKHLFYIRTHKQCRQRNLAEAVSCLVFASSRLTCGVIPELGEIRDLFGERYGESFVDTAVKLLPGNLVNPIFKKNIIALSPPVSAMPTDVIVKQTPVEPSFTSSSPDQAPARSSEQKKDDEVQCPKHVHPKLPDWDDIYTQFTALKKPKYVSPKLPDIAAKINALKIPKNENTADNYQLQLQYHEDHGSVDDGAIFNFHGCRNSIEFGITVINSHSLFIESLA